MDTLRLLWQRQRQQVLWLVGLAVMAFWSVALRAQDTDTALSLSWAEKYLTAPNITMLAALAFHFGALGQSLKQMRAELDSLKAWRAKFLETWKEEVAKDYARKDVLEPHFEAIFKRLESIDRKLG